MCKDDSINIVKNKLISFPKIVLDKLDEYKDKTGIDSTNYIRLAVIRQMVIDKLIYFQTKYISTKTKEDNINKKPIPDQLKYCDRESCEMK